MVTDGCAVQLSDRTSARKIFVADVPTPGGPYHSVIHYWRPLNLTLRDCPKGNAVLPRGSWWQCDMTARDHLFSVGNFLHYPRAMLSGAQYFCPVCAPRKHLNLALLLRCRRDLALTGSDI